MEKDNKYYNEIQEYLKANFERFISSVCDEFINYYGDRYKEEITHRLNDTNYIFYVNESKPLLNSFLDHFNSDNLTDNYTIIKKQYKKISKYFKRRKRYVDYYNAKNYNPEIFAIVNRKMLDTSNTQYSKEDMLLRESVLDKIINLHEICYFPLYLDDSEKVEHNVIIPLFKADDEGIVHEMIHSIMSQDLLLINDNEPYSKTGLAIENNAEELLEECITEIEAQEISKALKEKGIEFINKFYPKKFNGCQYNTFIPFFKDFYDYFKDELIYARITLNKNYLLELLNRNEYYGFIAVVEDCHKNYFEKYDFMYYKQSIDLEVDKMKNNYKVKKLV